MKTLSLLFLVMVGIGSVANASALRCKEVDAGPDNGYQVSISTDGGRASVDEVTIAGVQQLATLQCVASKQKAPPCCDRTYVLLTCSEPQVRDGGYSAVVTAGGLAGRMFLSLSKVTIAGSTQIANLLCF